MFVVAISAAGLAAFGPIYFNSTNQTILRSTLHQALPANEGLTLQASRARFAPKQLKAVTRMAPGPQGGGRWYGPPITTESAGFTTPAGTPTYVGHLVARTGVCHHLRIVHGSCATHPGTALLSTRTARALHLALGERLTTVVGRGRRAAFRIAGLYTPGNWRQPYWWGVNYFAFGYPITPPHLDAVFTSPATLTNAVPRQRIYEELQLPFVAQRLPVASVGAAEAGLSRFEARVASRYGVRATTRLPAVFSRAAATEGTTGTIIEVIDLQLTLLAIFVLYFVASRTASEREPDVRLAALRGFRPRSVLGVAMAEPIALVATAVPVGLFLAWAVAGATASMVFGPGIGASVTALSALAAVGAGVAGILATGLGVRQVLGAGADAPTGDATAARRSSKWRLVAEVAVVALAAAAFFELAAAGVGQRSGSTARALSAVAPALLALAVGVLAARVLPLALRATHERTAGWRRVTLAFATRRVARLREFAAPILLVTVSVGLATFAVTGWAVAGRNRQVRSEVEVGAPRVLTVSVPPGMTLLRVVHKADPSGHDAMAAVGERANDGTTLAVDSASMPSVMWWPPDLGITATTVARRLVPQGLAHPVVVRGTAVSVNIDTTSMRGNVIPSLSMTLYDQEDQGSVQVTLGRLAMGAHTYHGSLTGGCPGACRLTAIAVNGISPPGGQVTASGTVDMDITAVRDGSGNQSTAVAASLDNVRRWRGARGASVHHPAIGGLAVKVHLTAIGGTAATVSPADVPAALPAAVAPATGSTAPGQGSRTLLVGIDGNTVPGHPVAEIPDVPGVGANATLVDLGMAERFLTGSLVTDTTQVWLAATAPHSIVRSLTRQGVSVVGTTTTAAVGHELDRSGVSLAYLLFLIAAVAAAALAVSATAFGVAAGARRHRSELWTLRAVGLPLRYLRRFVWAEQSLALATGAVLGAASGLVAAAVALRSLPELASNANGPPLELQLAPVAAAITIGAVVLALACTVVGGASLVARGTDLTLSPSARRTRRQLHPPTSPTPLPNGPTSRPATTATAASTSPSLLNGGVHPGAAVHLAGVVHLYHQEGADIVGLRSVDLDVEPAEMVALLGPSGMGKTTVLRLMAGLMTPSAGSVQVDGRELGALSDAERRKLRAGEISYVVQDTLANVLPFATVKENLWFAQHGALTNGHRPPWTPGWLLDYLGLAPLGDVRVATLVMGLVQQVAIASGVAAGPRLLLADEPTAQLTPDATMGVVQLLHRVAASGTTVVLVTHDADVAAQVPRAVTIRDGRVGAEARDGQEFAVIDRSGSVQLPPEAIERLRLGTRVRVDYIDDGIVLRRPDEPEGRTENAGRS